MNSTIRTNFTIPAPIANAVVQRYSDKEEQRHAKVSNQAKVARQTKVV